MNKQILELLKSKNVVLEKGLSAKEFNHIKSIYNILLKENDICYL